MGISIAANKIRMKAHPFISFIIVAAAVGSVRGNSEVMESNSSFSCCEKPSIRFTQQCATTWTINNENFAHSSPLSTLCRPPCKKIEAGLMMMDKCAAVNATTVCTDEMKVTMEKRVHYYGQPCSGSLLAPGNQGSVGLVLMAVLISGLFVMQMIY